LEARPNITPRNLPNGATTPILVVTSGKGGVGKTSLSVSLAAELAARGKRVILCDADLGLANAHILLGVKPTMSLTQYVEEQAQLDQLMSDSAVGVKLISGGQGVEKMANLDAAGRRLVTDAIRDLRSYCDVLLIDTGAGISRMVTDFVALADLALIVTNANFAAVANAYGMIKVMVQSGHKAPMHVIVNRAHSTEEARQVFSKLNECAEQFLGVSVTWLGLVPEDPRVMQAVHRRAPFAILHPETVASQYLRQNVNRIEEWLAEHQKSVSALDHRQLEATTPRESGKGEV
jgi:flagellar biosynthesis protein FlhG